MDFRAKTTDVYACISYARYKNEIDDTINLSDEKASFIIKSIMCGIPPRIFVYRDKIIKGKEVIFALKKCFEGDLIFSGKLFEEINGKNYKEIKFLYHRLLEENFINIIEISIYSEKANIEYIINALDE